MLLKPLPLGTGVVNDIVCSWNEWNRLPEVIVGTARGAADIGFESPLSPYYPLDSSGREFRGQPVHDGIDAIFAM
ncbi:MAG TPA: hypothetical protein VIX91_03255 [Candidatus Acidoferrum sp.]